MQQHLRNIMSTNVQTIRMDQTIKEAAAIMSEYNIGSLPVVDHNGQLVGYCTDRDITLRATAQGESAQTPVSEVMTAQTIVKGTPDMDVHEAADLMSQHQIRRLPVVENGRVVGVVALGDLATTEIYRDEAEEALASISTPSAPQR